MGINPIVWQFVAWIQALEFQWIDLVGGTAVAVAVLLWEKFIAEKPISSKGWLAGLVVAFVLANFMAWKQQSDRASQDEVNLTAVTIRDQVQEARASSNLQASIQEVWTHHFGKTMGATLMVDVRNTGAPSVADYWAVFANLKRGPGGKIALVPYDAIQPYAISLPGGVLHYKPSYWLSYRTVENPIATGGDIKGFLNVLVPPNVDPKDVDLTSLSLTFNDVTGQTHGSMAVPYLINPPYIASPTLDQP